MDEARRHATEKIEDEISNMTEPVLDVVPEDIKEPHISKDVEKSSVKKHGGQKGKPLLECCKLGRDFWIRISYGNNSIQEKSLFQMGLLEKLPEECKDIEADEDEVYDRKGL